MELEFVLSLQIKGKDMKEIDDGLVQAAGQRLMARMVNPPNLNVIPKGVSVSVKAEEIKKETPVETKVETTKVDEVTDAKIDAAIEVADKTAEASEPPTVTAGEVLERLNAKLEEPKKRAGRPAKKADVEVVPVAITKEEATKALANIYSKYNIDKAKECLKTFSVARVQDLDPAKYGDFVAHCNLVANG